MKPHSLFIIVVFLSGCSTMYIPSAPNIPLFTEKKETNINVGLSTNSLFLSGGYAVSSKYAMIISSSLSYGNFGKYYDVGDLLYSGGEITFFYGGSFKHRNIELGFGEFYSYYEFGVLEFYGGLGYGNAIVSNKIYENNYGSIFFQVNNGLKKTNFELGGSFKLVGSYLFYYYPDELIDGTYQNTTMDFPVISCQLGGVIRFGNENFKFFISPGLNLSKGFFNADRDDLGEGFSNHETFYTIWHLSLGLSVNF